MFGFIARLAGGAIAPLVNQVSAFGASLLRKLALFLVAGVCFIVTLIALTIAFDLWIASLAGPIVAALAVAFVYLLVGVVAIVLALRSGAAPSAAMKPDAAAEAAADHTRTRQAQIDHFTAPLLGLLQSLGLRREQLAVLAGASLAKQLKPVPLVGLAVIAGFLIGRMWKGWDALLSTDLGAALLALLGMGRAKDEAAEPEDQAA